MKEGKFSHTIYTFSSFLVIYSHPLACLNLRKKIYVKSLLEMDISRSLKIGMS